jgi:hypothetical protein
VFSDVSALHEAILTKEPRSFVSHHIFEPVPFAFAGDFANWIEWRQVLADNLDVDPKDIVMTGSAAIGFSLNPHKNFRKFDESSDFDCGIISSYYFDLAWRYLRQLRVSWLDLPSKSRYAINQHRQRHIFSGTIAADSMLEILPFGQAWQAALDQMATVPPTIGREVKLRMYKDYDALRYYQSSGIERLREQIGSPLESDDIELAVEAEIEIREDK